MVFALPDSSPIEVQESPEVKTINAELPIHTLNSPPLTAPPKAPRPIATLWVSASKPSPANSPIIMLEWPVVISWPAAFPINIEPPPSVVTAWPASKPIAIVPSADVKASKAPLPIAILSSPPLIAPPSAL